jgi:hypothetical protein
MLALNASAKDHYIINAYFSSSSYFYSLPTSSQEDMMNTILGKLRSSYINGNVYDNSYTIVLTELSSQPKGDLAVTDVKANLSYDQLHDNLLSVLRQKPNNPNCPVSLSTFGILKYINSQLPPSVFFENTYILYINNDVIYDSNFSQYNNAIQLLKDRATSATALFNSTTIDDNAVTGPLDYKYTDPEDSTHFEHSLPIYITKSQLSFSDEYFNVISKTPRYKTNLIYDRLTQSGNKIQLFPSSPKDSICKIAMPSYEYVSSPAFYANNAEFTPDSKIDSLNIPLNWCFKSKNSNNESECGIQHPDATVMIETELKDSFPLYSLLKPYFIITNKYNINSLLEGHFVLHGNLINGIYDHLPYSVEIKFSIAIVPPKIFKKAGHKDVILDNDVLLKEANGRVMTQEQVLKELIDGKNKLKRILIIIISITIMIVIIFYYRKTEIVKRLFGKRLGG